MKAFEYASPATVSDAVKALAGSDDAAALAGGTDLINRMKDGVTSPKRVVSLKKVEGIDRIDKEAGSVGAGVTLAQVLADAELCAAVPAIAQAIREVGTPQIRNMATIGGNLLQRPRDWYYRNGFGLLGQAEGSEAHLLRAGDNRYAAIYMTEGDALYVNSSSLAPPLIALGGKATLEGPEGRRMIDVLDLYRVPKAAGESELTLKPGEVLTHVIGEDPAGWKNASYEVRHKAAHDWPLVLVSVACRMDGETVKEARVVLGSVAPVPIVCPFAAEAITGKAITAETAEAAGKASASRAKPLSKNAYKVKLVEVAVKRALLAAVGDRYWEA
jgi:xanthine dehydrogenase YagS FAD-binding subunit